ncbi:hypothetical protein E7T09_20310 [Deinococcus sp. KSM4-11]|uniref:COG1470 family protein n=1 Tax=Deinococcus sp. KSM4-11 TaxID=2568654 RepID=UPI0010A54FCB|nr:NEW3 domain-containing protein [Deinococcus sp. KSM4-11]THF84354.1 hypothetical protein E7T09_20310 [Deinococcus sp. KSM4-11]
MRAAVLTLSLLLSSAAGIQVVTPSGEQAIRAGQPLTLVFQLHNDTQTEWSGTPELQLPPGWRALFPPEAVQLQPGSDTTLLLPVEAPGSAAAGPYAVSVIASGIQATAAVRIPPRRNVTIRPEDEDTLGLDGKVTATFVVRNDGNVPEVLRFSADAPALQVGTPGATLAPGEQMRVTVAGTFPYSSSPARRVTLKVQGQDGLSKTVSVNRLLLRTGVPLEERSLTLKGQITFGVQSKTPSDLNLSGRLSADLPGTFRFSGSKSSWAADYQDQRVTFGVGYLSTGTLPLHPGTRVIGVSAALKGISWWSSASAGLQGKTFAGNVALGWSGARSSVALGLGTSEAGQTVAADVVGHADHLRAQVSGVVDLTSLAPKVQARLDYANRQTAVSLGAQYRATDFTSQPTADLRIIASVRAQLATGVTASLSGDYQVDPVTPGAAAAFTVAGRLAYRGNSWDTYLRMTGGQTTGTGLSFTSSRWRSSLAWTPAALTYQGSATIPVTSRPAVSLRLQPTITTTLDLRTSQLFTSAGLQANCDFQGGTASVGLTSPASQDGPWIVVGSTTMKVHEVDLKFSVLSAVGAGKPQTHLSAVMSVPLNIATAPRPDVGRIVGRIRYPDGRPFAGLRLQAGNLMAVSDAAGHFEFPAVHEGDVVLTLVNQDDAAGFHARPALPLKVAVRGEQVSNVDVQFSPGATVQGQLNLHWPAPEQSTGTLIVPAPPDMSELTVRLTGLEASYESRVNADGTFLLRNVVSGTYDVTLLTPEGTGLGTASLTNRVMVVPEDQLMLLPLEVIPTTQDVQIEDAGELNLK